MSFQRIIDTTHAIATRLVRGDLASIQRLMNVNTLFHPQKIHHNMTHIKDLFFTTSLNANVGSPSSLTYNLLGMPDTVLVQDTQLTFSDWLSARAVSAMVVLKNNEIAFETYGFDTKAEDLRMSWSMSKSVLSLLLGALIDKGLVPKSALDQPVITYVPQLENTGYHAATLRNVMNMASGVMFNEDYLDYNSDINKMGRLLALGGSIDAFSTTLGPRWDSGQYSHYVSIDTQVIGMVIRAITQGPLGPLLEQHILQPLGLEENPEMVTDQIGELFILGGLNLRTRDYARIGAMVLNQGYWNGHQIVSADWIAESTAPSAPPPSPIKMETPDRDLRYGYQWWVPPKATKGECFAIGVYGQYIYINPDHKTVIAMNSGDVKFKDGMGRITQENIEVFRQITAHLTRIVTV